MSMIPTWSIRPKSPLHNICHPSKVVPVCLSKPRTCIQTTWHNKVLSNNKQSHTTNTLPNSEVDIQCLLTAVFPNNTPIKHKGNVFRQIQIHGWRTDSSLLNDTRHIIQRSQQLVSCGSRTSELELVNWAFWCSSWIFHLLCTNCCFRIPLYQIRFLHAHIMR